MARGNDESSESLGNIASMFALSIQQIGRRGAETPRVSKRVRRTVRTNPEEQNG